MRELGPASTDEMVLCFLRAEIDSPIRGQFYKQILDILLFDRSSLIDNADLNDCRTNCVRGIVLGAIRGYGHNRALFDGFPPDTTWRHVLLDPVDFKSLKYIGDRASWQNLASTRSVEDGARNYVHDQALAARVDGLVQEINRGALIPELILVEEADRLVVLEGNTRATAYVKAATTSIPALIGNSPTMRQWAFV
jgi:hypothetical protein